MSEINGNCEILLQKTLDSVTELNLKMVKVTTDLDHMKEDISSTKKLYSKFNELSGIIHRVAGDFDVMKKGVEGTDEKIKHWEKSQRKQGERMEELKEDITNVKEELNADISAVKVQIAKLKVREAIVWAIMGVVMTGLIGSIVTIIISMITSTYYYGYGG